MPYTKKTDSTSSATAENLEHQKENETSRADNKKTKKYNQSDGIPCMSITSGELGMDGIKSNISYRWAELGDTTEVEYQDVVASIRQGTNFIFKPYFVIQDTELINQFPQVKKIYDSMYSGKDLKDILKLDPETMKTTIIGLPDGAKESIKNIASTQIANGQLDSVKKIKFLDEIFGTEMILMTGLFN